jgi:hypothetical protein
MFLQNEVSLAPASDFPCWFQCRDLLGYRRVRETAWGQHREAGVKRFTETTKWSDPWFRRLSPNAKLLWFYLTDNCDCAGLIDLDLDAASFFIGAKVQEKHLAELETRLERVVSGRVFISAFIGFQYGKLSRECKPHIPVFALLEKHQIDLEAIIKAKNERVYIPFGKGMERVQEKEKEKEGLGYRKGKPENREQVVEYCRERGLPETDGHHCFDKWEGNGFTNNGKPIRDWKATIRSWQTMHYLPSQNSRIGSSSFSRPLSFKEREKERGRIQEELDMMFHLKEQEHREFTKEEKQERQQLRDQLKSL